MGLKTLNSSTNKRLRKDYQRYLDSINMLTRTRQDERTSREDIVNTARILKENQDYAAVATDEEKSEIEAIIRENKKKLK